MKNAIIFSGSGGQGIMSMGTMLAQSAVESGKHAVYMPSYGPEQRGGSAKCVVIIDDKEITSPMAEYGGVLVAMSNMAYEKFIHELEPGGILIYDNSVVTDTIERTDIKAVPIPAGDLAIEVGSAKVANVLVDGVLLGLYDIVSPENFQKSLDAKFAGKSSKVREMNTIAFRKGLELAQKYK